MEGPEDDGRAARARAEMVERLRTHGHGSDPILAAMGRVPRHRFIDRFWIRFPGSTNAELTLRQAGDPDFLQLAYHPAQSLFTRLVDGEPTSAASGPNLVADMLAMAQLAPGMRVLEIGAGTGYNAALVAELVGDPRLVSTVDIDAGLVSSAREHLAVLGFGDVEVVHGDGFAGHPSGGPFDRIIATVGCPDLAPAWFDQLADGGLMLVPLEHASWHPLVLVGASGEARTVGRSGFVSIQGEMDRPGPWPARRPHPPAPDRDPVPAPAWLSEAVGPAPDAGSHPVPLWHLSLYLALADQRARYWGVDDADGCYAALGQDAAQVTRRGEHSPELAGELIEHLEDWNRAGRPGIDRYLHRFVPLNASPGACTWAITRAYFRQETTLTGPA